MYQIMTTTIINTSLVDPFLFYDTTQVIDLNGRFGVKCAGIPDTSIREHNKDHTPPKSLSFISDDIKIIIPLNIGMFNMFYVNFYQIWLANKLYPNSTIILDTSGVRSDLDSHYYLFLLTMLTDLKIKYQVIDTTNYNYIVANNFALTITHEPTKEITEELFNFYSKYFTLNDNPKDKIYISRRHIPDRSYQQIEGIKCNDDNRLYDHYVLEDYLAKKGFHIVIPEMLTNFQEQMQLFANAKTIISLTSSGISNMIFMPSGSTVIEFVTPIATPIGDLSNGNIVKGFEGIHHLYHAMSFIKNHAYVGIPNPTKKSEDIIKLIEQNEILSRIINE